MQSVVYCEACGRGVNLLQNESIFKCSGCGKQICSSCTGRSCVKKSDGSGSSESIDILCAGCGRVFCASCVCQTLVRIRKRPEAFDFKHYLSIYFCETCFRGLPYRKELKHLKESDSWRNDLLITITGEGEENFFWSSEVSTHKKRGVRGRKIEN